MSDDRSSREQLLDLVVYAPAGLVMAAVEEVPRLAARGRQGLETQASTAKFIGEMAVRFGRSEIEKRLARLLPSPPPPPPPSPRPAAAGPRPAPTPVRPNPGATSAGPTGPGPDRPLGSGQSGRRATADLAIPGYDSLSASQVVQRLGGLDRIELDAVQAYELSNRARRTVLSKIEQLHDGGKGVDGPAT
jgi:hypothetical protein